MPPGPRAGFSMCVHKKRAVLFGGVVDMEVEGKFFTYMKAYFSLVLSHSKIILGMFENLAYNSLGLLSANEL